MVLKKPEQYLERIKIIDEGLRRAEEVEGGVPKEYAWDFAESVECLKALRERCQSIYDIVKEERFKYVYTTSLDRLPNLFRVLLLDEAALLERSELKLEKVLFKTGANKKMGAGLVISYCNHPKDIFDAVRSDGILRSFAHTSQWEIERENDGRKGSEGSEGPSGSEGEG